MKRIEAIIRPNKLASVRRALEKAGSPGMMITDVQGVGRQQGLVKQWRGESYKVDLLQKVKVEVVVKDADVDKITKAIVDVAKTGKIGDGKIFVSDVADAIRIRTGETGEAGI